MSEELEPHVAAIAARFPHTDEAALRGAFGQSGGIVRHLADTHDLTEDEARDALETLLLLRL